MTDFLLLEKISELNSQLPSPRLIHEKGVAVKGTFYPYMSLSDYTKAGFLQSPEIETPVTVRFSRTMGQAGSGDSLRDTRGFAAKFSCGQNDYDLICHNMPVYYINDPARFPAMISKLASSKQGKGMRADFWGFLAENPEAVNLAFWLYSNRGTLKSYRYMEGYSVNTYKWINQQDQELYVRYRWNPVCEGEEHDKRRAGISYQEAEFLAGFSPDSCTCDLISAIKEGDFPVYDLEIQMMDAYHAVHCGFDFLSTTLFWPQDQYPYIKIGKMVLNNTIPEEKQESLCFVPSNLIEGIQFGNKEMLEIMSYAHKDAGRRRGGVK